MDSKPADDPQNFQFSDPQGYLEGIKNKFDEVRKAKWQDYVEANKKNTALNIILFGNSGVGKSSTLNFLLGEQAAKVGTSGASETYDVSIIKGEIHGQKVNLYDTPGMQDTKGLTGQAIMFKILRCIATSETGQIDCILLLENPNNDRNYGGVRLSELNAILGGAQKPLGESVIMLANKSEEFFNVKKSKLKAKMEELSKRIVEIHNSVTEYKYDSIPILWTNMIADGCDMYDMDGEQPEDQKTFIDLQRWLFVNTMNEVKPVDASVINELRNGYFNVREQVLQGLGVQLESTRQQKSRAEWVIDYVEYGGFLWLTKIYHYKWVSAEWSYQTVACSNVIKRVKFSESGSGYCEVHQGGVGHKFVTFRYYASRDSYYVKPEIVTSDLSDEKMKLIEEKVIHLFHNNLIKDGKFQTMENTVRDALAEFKPTKFAFEQEGYEWKI